MLWERQSHLELQASFGYTTKPRETSITRIGNRYRNIEVALG